MSQTKNADRNRSTSFLHRLHWYAVVFADWPTFGAAFGFPSQVVIQQVYIHQSITTASTNHSLGLHTNAEQNPDHRKNNARNSTWCRSVETALCWLRGHLRGVKMTKCLTAPSLDTYSKKKGLEAKS